ncbi:hypothetical protein F5884DRAFT_763061 [Xylogone sp. PMI_703]|nr:hypothetical protein F5884DRAFT_763061 [Xylogone sp. PMI_703]
MAFYDPDALNLKGVPSKPVEGKKEPVLVYGAATASGTMACQLLRLSGYIPIAVTSHLPASSSLAMKYGAVDTAAYTSPTCNQTIRTLAAGAPIRYALDCITSAESVSICFASIARTGGRYACLENLNDAWRTRSRQIVNTKEVMGYEGLGIRVDLDHYGMENEQGTSRGDTGSNGNNGSTSTYSREANHALFTMVANWAAEMQSALDRGLIRAHPVREVPGGWEGIITGLNELRRGEVRGQKLVVRISDEERDSISS